MEVQTVEDERRAEMKEALKLTPYANRPPRTPVLQCDRIIR